MHVLNMQGKVIVQTMAADNTEFPVTLYAIVGCPEVLLIIVDVAPVASFPQLVAANQTKMSRSVPVERAT